MGVPTLLSYSWSYACSYVCTANLTYLSQWLVLKHLCDCVSFLPTKHWYNVIASSPRLLPVFQCCTLKNEREPGIYNHMTHVMPTLHDSAKMVALESCRFHSISCPYLDDYHFFEVSKSCLTLASRCESIVYSDFELEHLQVCWPFVSPTLDNYPSFTLPRLYMGWPQSCGIRYQASSRFQHATLKNWEEPGGRD